MSWLRTKPRPKARKVQWRTGNVKETSAGMARLRADAFHRSGGICECGRHACKNKPTRERRVTWIDGHLHHLKKHGNRSDELAWVRFTRRECHRILTGKLQFGWYKQGRAA